MRGLFVGDAMLKNKADPDLAQTLAGLTANWNQGIEIRGSGLEFRG